MKRYREEWSSDEDDLLKEAMDDFERTQQVGGAAAAPQFEYTWSSDEDGDDLLNQAMDDFERTQQVGGAAASAAPLFAFQMDIVGPRKNWKNVVNQTQFRAQLKQLRDPIDGDDIGAEITNALHTAIEVELRREKRNDNDFVNFSITAQAFQHAYQSINFTVKEFLARSKSVRLNQLLEQLAGKLNSNESFQHNQSFEVNVVFVKRPRPGSGKKYRNPGQRCMDNENKRKRCIIAIENDDDLCCSRAIITMKAHCHRHDGVDGHRNWENTKRGLPIQQRLARELCELAGVKPGPCGLEELQKFQEYLQPEYQLLVMCRTKPFFLIFKGPPAPKQICLLKSDEHYDGCTSFSAFINRSYWCSLCEKGFNVQDAKHHPCEGRTCHSCNQTDCPDYKRDGHPTLICDWCHCRFYGANCFQHHLKTKQCQTHKTCLKCYAEYNVIKGKRHRCGFAPCPSCKQVVDMQSHKCFIQPHVEKESQPEMDEEGNEKQPLPPPLFVWADIEAMQLPDREFEPNMLSYRTSESENIVTRKGKECVCRFVHDLDDFTDIPNDDRDRTIIVLFHNLKGYDGVFLINELYKQKRTVENQLTIGSKVLAFESGTLMFKDSLCFIPFPLAAFPATFNLTELKKGFFPHQFNLPHHQDYVGRIPDLEFFDPEGKSEKKKKELEEWHKEQVKRGVQYDFAKEMEDYCKSDVALLQAGCAAFVKEFESHAGFNPFEKCVTIASACHLYWRKHCIEENTIAVEPLRGWRGANVNQSAKALQWLLYEEDRMQKKDASPDRIKHVRNGGEQCITTPTDSYFVDGFNPATNTVYEFYGCFWHGCRTCYSNNRHCKHAVNPDRTMEQLYTATQAKEDTLRTAGYQVNVMWECQWDEICKTNPFVKNFISDLKLVEPLEPRQAFFGGRTGAVALHAVAGEGEEIRYVDVTSLYPWVNKNCVYPIGHPSIFTNPRNQDINAYFGLATVDIIPPSDLFHPVLPVRSGDKLTFPLCGKCVQEEQSKVMLERSDVCQHTPEERMFRGTWCTPELHKAVEKGYKVIKIFEVWHFGPKQRRKGLFQNYVNTFLKLKQEASGWPAEVGDDPEKRQDYIANYLRHENIQLDPEKIEKNPGKRATAKLMLNSFWGKFGEKQNKPKTVTITQPSQLYPYLFLSNFSLRNLRICTEDVLEAVITEVEDNVVPSNKTNIFVAAFTTAWARLKLYEALDVLKEQVLYYDTDSVIYKWRPNAPELPLGQYLGQFTNELDDPNDYITEFVSGGAKNYAYRTIQGKNQCKVRGFTLNVRGKQVLNFNTMKANILAEIEDPKEERRVIKVTNPNHFKRDTTHKSIKLVEQMKKYGLVFDKRVIDKDTKMSYPFGYRVLTEPDRENVNNL